MSAPSAPDNPPAQNQREAERLHRWLTSKENECLEFKEAKNNFHFEKLVKYCAALANEGGGSIVLGVTDRIPRQVVGTSTFGDLERTKAALVERLRIRIQAEAIAHPKGRVVVFTAPARPMGLAIAVDGAYWMRAGEDLVAMTPDLLQRIFAEAAPDFSAEICPAASPDDLDPSAIEEFRNRWHSRSKEKALMRLTPAQLLHDAELVKEGGVTYAALILLGTHGALGRHLAHAETIFEYRSSEAAGPAHQREEFRRGFLLWHERIWELIETRNDLQHYQDGFFMMPVPTFNRTATREAILNAVAHRDYRNGGSIFVRQFSRRLEIDSPGGFPKGVTPENMIDRHLPRNRLIADSLSRCGLVERAGQGANRMFEMCIRESKVPPDFRRSDDWQVSVILHGQLGDPSLLKFLQRLESNSQSPIGLPELQVLDLVHRKQVIPAHWIQTLTRLRDLGIVETAGRGRGVRLILGRRFLTSGNSSSYPSRRRGIDDLQSKESILRHLKDAGDTGCTTPELQRAVPAASRDQLKRMLGELKREGRARLVGTRRHARWQAGFGALNRP